MTGKTGRSRRRLWWIGGAVAVVIVVALGQLGSRAEDRCRPGDRFETVPFLSPLVKRREDASLYEFRMHDERYAIPRNYFVSGLPCTDEPLTDGLRMVMLWPGLEAFTEENAEEFRKPGWNRKVRVLLTPAGRKARGETLLNLFREGAATESKDVELGWIRYNFEDYRRTTDVYLVDRESHLYLLCKKPGSVPNPSCQSIYALSDGVDVQMSFSRNFIGSFLEIKQQFDDLINGSRIQPEEFNP